MADKEYGYQRWDLPPEVKVTMVRRFLWRLIARMVRIVEEKYGEEGLSILSEGIRDWDYWNVSVERAGIVPGQCSLRDLFCKLFAPSDDLVAGFAEEPVISEAPDESRLLYRAASCGIARVVAGECDKTCAVVARAMEEGVTKVANPNIKLSGDRYLSRGDDACCIYAEMRQPVDAQ